MTQIRKVLNIKQQSGDGYKHEIDQNQQLQCGNEKTAKAIHSKQTQERILIAIIQKME